MSDTLEKQPTPKEIDALIAKYAALQAVVVAAAAAKSEATAKADAVKVELTALVERWGNKHAEKSKRLAGLRNTATTTTGTQVSVDDAAVDKLRGYLDSQEQPELSRRFFSERITYQLVDAPAEVLKTVTLATSVRGKITRLLGLCFRIEAKKPSLKVDVVEAQAA